MVRQSFYVVSTSASIFFILYVKPIRSLLIQRTPERFSRKREAGAFRLKERKDTTDDKNFNQTKTRIILEMLFMSLSTKRDIIIRKITHKFLMKLRWLKNKSLWDNMKLLCKK